VRRWHWISSAVCLTGMILFGATGLTLNHADELEPEPRSTTKVETLPAPLVASVAAGPAAGAAPLPPPVAAWVRSRFGLDASRQKAEWSAEQVTLSMPRPGGERAASIDRASGLVSYESSSRGVVGTLNDLHTGRNSGRTWSLFIDVFAIGCLTFATTGLALVCLYAPGRPVAWPLLAAGAAAPVLVGLLALFHVM
jgi:hypothetical protein